MEIKYRGVQQQIAKIYSFMKKELIISTVQCAKKIIA